MLLGPTSDSEETSSRDDTVNAPNTLLAHLTLPVEFPGLHSQESNCVFTKHIKFLEKLMHHIDLQSQTSGLLYIQQSTTELANHVWPQEEINYTLALGEGS